MNEATRIAADAAFDPRFTARDYESMLKMGAFSDLRVELVEGVLEKMMPSHLAHGECSMRLGALLIAVYAHVPVRIAGDLAIRLNDATVRAPDLAVVRIDTPDRQIPDAAFVTLAIEVADSSLGRDLGDKAADYASASIANYWVVDLNGEVIHALSEPEGGSYRRTTVYRFGEPVPVPGTERTITLG